MKLCALPILFIFISPSLYSGEGDSGNTQLLSSQLHDLIHVSREYRDQIDQIESQNYQFFWKSLISIAKKLQNRHVRARLLQFISKRISVDNEIIHMNKVIRQLRSAAENDPALIVMVNRLSSQLANTFDREFTLIKKDREIRLKIDSIKERLILSYTDISAHLIEVERIVSSNLRLWSSLHELVYDNPSHPLHKQLDELVSNFQRLTEARDKLNYLIENNRNVWSSLT